MRILALDLRAFGPFSDFQLDLSQGNHGLHVIYGPNEAGKSTTLRALEQLLFGIPANSTDNFVHPYQKLRIGATLGGPNASRLALLRRKGNKNTLLEPDDKTPLEDAELDRFLGGLDQGVFATMFGINHQRLQDGGHALATGGGKVGATLFAAASGISHLQSICDGLEVEAKKLFTTRPSKAAINTNLAALKNVRKSIREAQLPSSEWVEHQEALRQANQRLEQVDAELQEASRQRSRLDRLQHALPLVVKRKAILQQQTTLGRVIVLPADFAERWRETVTTLATARRAEQDACELIEQLNRQIERLVVPEALLAETESIENMRERLGAHRKAQNDRLGLRANQEQLRRYAEALLGQLRPDLTLEVVDPLRLTSQQKVGIQNLGNRHGALVKQLEQVQADIEQLQTQLGHVEEDLRCLEEPRDVRWLRDAVRRAQGQGDLDNQAATVEAELERLRRQAAVELKRLPLWSGSLEALEELAVPGAETVDHFEDRLADVERDITMLQNARQEADSQLAERRRQREELQLQGEVPTESDLAAARRRRELGWQLVLEAWQKGEPDAGTLADFLAESNRATDLAAAYAAAVQAADDVGDRLRREADHVARRATLQSEQNKIEQQIADLERRLHDGTTQRQETWQAWVECWRPLGIEPRWPREMRAWLERQRALLVQAEAIRNGHGALDQLRQRIGAHRQELETCLAELGQREAAGGDPLPALLDHCQALLDHVASIAQRRQRLEADRERLTRQTTDARQSAEQAEARLAEWRQQWAVAIEPLGLPLETPPEVANEFVARLGDLFERLDAARNLALRIEQIEQDAAQFHGDVASLTRQVDAELSRLEPEQQAEELVRRLRAAVSDKQNLDTLGRQRAHHEVALAGGRRTVELMTVRLEAMCQEAVCGNAEELPDAIKASGEAFRLREQLQGVDEQLMRLCGAGSLEALIVEAEGVDADRLPIERARLGEQIECLEIERGELRETRGREQKTLETLDTGSSAADAAEAAQDLLARIEADALEYARLRIASVVLREGIERYRKKNEDPVLRRAGELFRRLTLGSFEELRADIDDRGENVLVGVRGDSSAPVGLAGMSDGTCDQLYLALRLATLETYLQQNEPVPLVVDDVLIGFDDRRASAALEVLGEFARRTQVLFFTHHAHLVELAENCLEPDQRFVHRLPGRIVP